MKKLVLLISLMAVAQLARAQDTATFDFRIDHQKAIERVVIELDADAAPATVANFEKLVRHKFYKGLKVHRVIPHTLVQMGIRSRGGRIARGWGRVDRGIRCRRRFTCAIRWGRWRWRGCRMR